MTRMLHVTLVGDIKGWKIVVRRAVDVRVFLWKRITKLKSKFVRRGISDDEKQGFELVGVMGVKAVVGWFIDKSHGHHSLCLFLSVKLNCRTLILLGVHVTQTEVMIN